MRIGAPVYNWNDPESWALRHVERGWGAAYFPLNHAAPAADIQAFADAAARHGLVIAEIGVWNNQFDPDERKREANFEYAVNQLKLADAVGARCCVNISGSLSSVWDGPHPGNITPETYERVVLNVQAIIDAARPQRTFYTLEPMPWMYPHCAADLENLLRDVNRERFAVHADMCNLVNAFDKVYHTGELTREFFGAFGPRIRVVHAKDTVLLDSLTTRVAEAIPGEGVFDYDALLTECARLDPDLPVMAEHLATEEEYRRATDFIAGKARALGIAPVGGY